MCYTMYFSTDISLPPDMQRSMAAEAEASREARAKVEHYIQYNTMEVYVFSTFFSLSPIKHAVV